MPVQTDAGMTCRRATLGLVFLAAFVTAAIAATPSTVTPDLNPSRDGNINFDHRPQAAKQDTHIAAQTGNPLWAIPLSSLSNTRDHPIFSPSRRPPPVAVPPVVVARQPAAEPVKPAPPQLQLLGTLTGTSAAIAVMVASATGNIVRLKIGEKYDAWVLRTVERRAVTLQMGDQTEVLALPELADHKSAPLAQSTPSVPAALPVQAGSPVLVAFPAAVRRPISTKPPQPLVFSPAVRRACP